MTSIPCGCGDYAVEVPDGAAPEGLDAVCPECGNHFGYGSGEEDGDRYEAGDFESEGAATETVRARDGEISAVVSVSVDAPGVEPASEVCAALAAANRSIVDRVFSPDPPEDIERAAAGRAAPGGEEGGGDGDDEEEGRPMDMPDMEDGP